MWIALAAVAATLPVMLFLPVRIRFFVRLSAGVSHIRLELRLFGLFPVYRTLRLHLFSEPYMSLIMMGHRYTFRQIPLFGNKKKGPSLRKLITFDRVHAVYFVGLPGDAAATAFLCGAVSTAGELALSRLFREVKSTPLPVFDRAIFRINLEGIASLVPVKSIRILLRKK